MDKNLSIKQIQALKKEMEGDIEKLVSEFEQTYDLHVEELELHCSRSMEQGGSRVYAVTARVVL